MSNLTYAPRPAAAHAVGPLLPVASANLPVPLASGGERRYVDLDVAATAPALARVAARVAEVSPYLGSVHRGAGLLSRWSTQLLADARATVGERVGARDDDAVIFTRNTTDAVNLLAQIVPDGGGIVSLDIEHHANLLPWRARADHRLLTAASTLEQTLELIAAELAARPTALLAVTAASNVTGELTPIERLASIAHAHGTRLFVDGAQLAPHRPIDLRVCGADYIAFSGHKLYAPFGAGVLIGRRDWLDNGRPYLAGGGAVREVARCNTRWADGPQRHEAGTPNLLGAVALAEALDALSELPATALQRHERALTEQLDNGLEQIGGVAVQRIWDDSDERIGVACLTVDGYRPSLVAAYLSAEHAIGVRDGRFCAHPLLARFGLGADGAVRVSVGVGSASADIERLLVALQALVNYGPQLDYRADGAGGYEPVDDIRLPPPALRRWNLAQHAASVAPTSPCVTA